ncbi:DMT family transporter [Tardiphaga sp.]|uniref:DMT family transporter n=1 Tax=Tardiphaga sp. TaxID=1926292 RepID=UPI00261277F7|nr:DMT family transporter [Tardiphaga sp.]
MSIEVLRAPAPLAAGENSAMRQRLAGFAWAALAVGIFSGWFVVTRFSVTHELRIWDIIALRFGIGGVLLLPVLLGSRRQLPAKAWLEGMLFALLWGAPFVFLVGLGLQLTSAAEASAITPALMPVFAGLLAWPTLREVPGRTRLIGYLVIVAGLIALVVGNAQLPGWPSPAGIALLIGAGFTWAIYTLLFRRSGLSPLQAGALICFWSAVLYLPVYLWFGLSRFALASTQELAFQVIYQGVLMSVVATIAFNRAVTLLGAAAAAAMIALLPVIVSTLAIPVLREIPSWLEGVAIVVIAVGVLLAARPTPILEPSLFRAPRQKEPT